MTVNRILTNIITPNLEASTRFYTDLLDLIVQFESNWFVQLVSEQSGLELGLLISNHELVPQEFQGHPAGFYITFVVDDANAIYAKANLMNIDILQPPEMTSYGQLRMLLKDPAGTLIDISSVA